MFLTACSFIRIYLFNVIPTVTVGLTCKPVTASVIDESGVVLPILRIYIFAFIRIYCNSFIGNKYIQVVICAVKASTSLLLYRILPAIYKEHTRVYIKETKLLYAYENYF